MSDTKITFTLHKQAFEASLEQAQEMLRLMNESGEGRAPIASTKTFDAKDKDGNIHLFTFLVLT
jgi:hypothetical protein